MPGGNAYTWTISGRILKIDGITPFTFSDGLSLRMFHSTSGGVSELGYAGIGDNNGTFSFSLNKQQISGVEADLIIRVYDSQGRILYESGVFTISDSEDTYLVGSFVVTSMPIPSVWRVRGIAFNNNVSTIFNQGLIYAYDGQTGTEMYAQTGFGWQDGTFSLVLNRDQFQNGNVNKIAPDIILKIFDYSQNLLWQYGPFTLPHSDYYINPVVGGSVGNVIVPNIPEVPENWSVYGTVLEDGHLPSNLLKVKAFDVLYGVETLLGETQTDANVNGDYRINYNKSAFQNGDTGRIAPNLLVRVFSINDVPITTSNLFIQADNYKEVDIELPLGGIVDPENPIDPENPEIPINPTEPVEWEVFGNIFENDQSLSGTLNPLVSGHVDVWEVYNGREYPIGSDTLDSEGNYSVAYTVDKFQHGDSGNTYPHLLIRVYDFGGVMLGHSDIGYQYSEKYQYNFTVPMVTKIFHASGKILNTVGYPVSGCVVIVKSILLSGGSFREIELGRVISGRQIQGSGEIVSDGVYSLSFYPELVTNLELDQARFVVEVYKTEDEAIGEGPVETQPKLSELVAKSSLVKAEDGTITVDFVIDIPSTADISTYTEVAKRLENTGIDEKSLAELVSDESKLDYVAELTGGSKEELLEIVLAASIFLTLQDRLKAYSDIPDLIDRQVIYALVKTGNVKSYQDLLKITSDRLQTVIISAVTQSIIPPSIQEQLLNIVSEWRKIYSILLTISGDKSNAARIFRYVVWGAGEQDIYSILLTTNPIQNNAGLIFRYVVWGADEQDIYSVLLTTDREKDNSGRIFRHAIWETGEYGEYEEAVQSAYDEHAFDLEAFWVALEEKEVHPALIEKLKTLFAIQKAYIENAHNEPAFWVALQAGNVPIDTINKLKCFFAIQSAYVGNASNLNIFWNKLQEKGVSTDYINDLKIFFAIQSAYTRYASDSVAFFAELQEKSVPQDIIDNIILFFNMQNAYAEYSHNLEKFWIRLEEDEINDDVINRTKFFFDIHRFADEFGPLSNAMMKYADKQSFTTLERFVTLEKSEWFCGVIENIKDFTEIENADEVTEWPESVPGESDKEKRGNYAVILYKKIIELFPMDRFRFDIQNAMGEGFDTSELWQPIYEFLNIKTTFDFADAIREEDFHDVENMESDASYILGFTEEKVRKLYGDLLIVQRLYRLTPKFKTIDALIEEEFTSAMSIAHKNCDVFVEQCSERVGGIDDAQTLHATAVHTASQALFLMGTFNQQTDLPQSSIPSLTERFSESGESNAKSKSVAPLTVSKESVRGQSTTKLSRSGNVVGNEPVYTIKPIVPDIATLFGKQNQCLCQECQSVFSPSAYMVDLLEFLNEDVREELFKRRPDLSEIDLSCRNTNGGVAYIDLVNEILENAVSQRKFSVVDSQCFKQYLDKKQNDGDGLSDSTLATVINEFSANGFYINKDFYVQTIHNESEKVYIVGDGQRYLIEKSGNTGNEIFEVTSYPQTGKDAQARRIKPEHTHRDAYEIVLKNASRHPSLPFNLPFVEVNEFLKLKKSSRYELCHSLMPRRETLSDIKKDEADKSSMQAFFEMTDEQNELITGVRENVWEMWGFSSEVDSSGRNWIDSLGNAESVMKRLDITLEQFLDLMHTYFVCRPGDSGYLYLDWGNDDAYENGELDKLLLWKYSDNPSAQDKREPLAAMDYFRMVSLQRLSNHLGLDVITTDRLISIQVESTINNSVLVNIYQSLKIAREFSVSPIHAASWLRCWIENFNLGRGKPSQFEELFISNIDDPGRAATWKEMLNDTISGTRAFEVGNDANDKDIATLLKGLNVNYHDLSLIAKKEFDSNLTDAKNILNGRPLLTIENLAKMYRVADFSRVLAITVSDFYTLQSILVDASFSATIFSLEFLIECRSILQKLKRFKISVAEFRYLLSGDNQAKISWLPAENAKANMILKVRGEVAKTKLAYAEDALDLPNAIEETILNELAGSHKISVDVCRIILEKVLRGDGGHSLLQYWVDICDKEVSDVTDTENTSLEKVAMVSFLIRALNIAVDEFDFFADNLKHLSAVTGFDFNDLGTSQAKTQYKSLVTLLDTYILNNELPFKNKNFTVFHLLRETQKVDFNAEKIANAVDWQRENVQGVITKLLLTGNLNKTDSWIALNSTCGLLKRLGLAASSAISLISNADNTMAQSEELISALRATYSKSQWIEAAEPIRNNLRRRQRDALCAYLLSTGEFNNRAAIYAKYLIDVNMDTDVMTTRIVQANSSIQMFLQRALLNFEPNVSLDDKIKQQWHWMKNYRLWEANRKIFLYPENWLEPEFRDDKTPLFKELESAILQKELSPSSVNDAFKAYTSGLSDVANLEVIGAYGEEGQGGKVLHIVGRTFHYPYSYYYRKNVEAIGGSGYWSPWEKIDLDITADVVMPVPFRNKIYIFWPIIEIKEKTIENEKKNITKDDARYTDSFKYYELKLAWSEYSDGKWSAKRLSQDTFTHIFENIDSGLVNATDLFHFKAEIKSGEVEIQVFAYNKTIEEIKTKKLVFRDVRQKLVFNITRTIRIPELETTLYRNEIEAILKIAAFSFGTDNSARLVPIIDTHDYMKSEMIPSGTTMRHNRAEESDINPNKSDFGALEYPVKNLLLKRTPELFTCFPTNLSFFDSTPKPFFLRLNEKTLFVKQVSPPKQSLSFKIKDLFRNHVSFLDRIKAMLKTLDSDNKTYHQIVNFYHPLADDLVKRANLGSIDDLLNRSVQANAKDQYPLGYAAAGDDHANHLANLSFKYQYLPQDTVLGDYPVPVNEFSLNSPFGVYNWELFFHLPMYIANRLSHDKQYEEAMRWFHYIFNPANDFTTWEKTQRWVWDLPDGARFWNFLPFFANRGVQDSIYKAVEESQIPNEDTKLGNLIEDWKNDPFKPHLIARVRMAAYQKAVVMKYLDNLIEWGDSLFRLDYMEAINEATQLYTHASEILGDRPVLVPQLHEMPGLTYTQLKAEGLDQFSNTVIQLENYIPPAPPIKVRFWRAKQAPSRYYYYHYNYNYTYNSSVEAIPHRSVQLLRMAPALHYFCIPRNQRLISYWDTVEDRLFKIHYSMNIDGVKRVIPLFAPPIDPGMLARASAAGINIGALLRDMQSAPTVYRYATVYQKALELCNELKAFGSELLSALEKKDAESMAHLRNEDEIELLTLVKDIKKKTVEESKQNLESLLKAKTITEERYNYYNGIERTSEGEILQLASSAAAGILHTVGQAMSMGAAPLAALPDLYVGGLVGLGGGPLVFSHVAGGEKTSDPLSKVANALTLSAGILDRVASVSGTKASYDRRWAEWKLQERLAKKELDQLDKQILSAQIRVQIAENDLSNHEKQIEQAQSLKEVMESKFSNENLYVWMSEELNKSYNALYDIAYSAAKKAEKAFQFELGVTDSFITPDIWESSKKGLLAANKLSIQLRQLDAAYIENNRRELEITKTVSLSMLNPEELLRLRETGSCDFTLSELIYDIDCPGQYFRRIKSVRVTIPCVTGPYTNISAKLTLLNNRVRVNTQLDDEYSEKGSEDQATDDRFLYGPIPNTSITTSGAMMDSGMFDFNFRDERYLPFEGGGAISTWHLELPADFRQFDYGTITDVILHVSYTAREVADSKREAADSKSSFIEGVNKCLGECLASMEHIPNLISLKQSFLVEFESIVGGGVESISLEEKHFPHLVVDYCKRNKLEIPSIKGLKVFVLLKEVPTSDVTIEITLTQSEEKEGCVSLLDDGGKLFMRDFGEFNEDIRSLNLGVGISAGTSEIEDILLYFWYPVKQGES